MMRIRFFFTRSRDARIINSHCHGKTGSTYSNLMTRLRVPSEDVLRNYDKYLWWRLKLRIYEFAGFTLISFRENGSSDEPKAFPPLCSLLSQIYVDIYRISDNVFRSMLSACFRHFHWMLSRSCRSENPHLDSNFSDKKISQKDYTPLL